MLYHMATLYHISYLAKGINFPDAICFWPRINLSSYPTVTKAYLE